MVKFEIIPHDLNFVKPAKTSRNVFKSRRIYLLHKWDDQTGQEAWAEAAPLSLLSIDDVENYDEVLANLCQEYLTKNELESLDLERFPSIRFALETLHKSWELESPLQVFDCPFYDGKQIPINGLVWMADSQSMLQEAIEKARLGFTTIKFKVGALDFDEECRMLEEFRKNCPASSVEIRLDANGAFQADEAIQKLKDLSRFQVHSIEQPIAAKQWDALEEICSKSKIEVALDEELIGLSAAKDGYKLLSKSRASYLILKPNLLGGFTACDEWIALCQKMNLGWWATSALEGNIGLNAIAQWVSGYANRLPQGLGTGALYKNNIESPLQVGKGFLRYAQNINWELP